MEERGWVEEENGARNRAVGRGDEDMEKSKGIERVPRDEALVSRGKLHTNMGYARQVP